MAEAKPVAVVAMDVPARTSTIYPPEYAGPLKGREKRVLGDLFGLDQFGVNLTVLQPGASSSERHWHQIEDEFIYVVEGEITLVDNAGEHKLTPGMCAGFKANVPNGHKLVNQTHRPARYLEIGTRSPKEAVYYSDINMKGIKTTGKYAFTKKDGSPL